MTSILSAVIEEAELGDENLEGSIANKASVDLKPLFEELYGTDDGISEERLKERPNHLQVWKEIEDEFETKRKAIQEYKQSKELNADLPPNPDVEYLNQNVFPLLLKSLEKTLVKAKELNCLKHQKNRFNGIDYIAELLWNLNPNHPERHKSHVYIFNMEWVKEWLKRNPRPFYPFSYLWSREFAATKIQAAMRGHWVRRTEEVQEMRQFWKELAIEKKDQQDIA